MKSNEGTDTGRLDRIADKLHRWQNLLAKKRQARIRASGANVQQIELLITIIERICDDLSDLLQGSLSETDEDSGIAIFDRQGFAWLSNHHNPVDALEEFDREIGMDPRDRSLSRMAKKHTLFEIPEQDLPLWRDASLGDHPDTDDLQRVAL